MKRVGYVLTILVVVLSFLAADGSAMGETAFERAERTARLDPQVPTTPLTTAFTYQGMLHLSGVPYSGTCDFYFVLWDAAIGGSQVTGASNPTLGVADGLFIASLDYGAGAFDGNRRWLEVLARCPTGVGSYISLGRQELSAAPYSQYSLESASVPWSGITGRPAGLDDGDNDVVGGLSCASGQLPKWNGSAWACAADNDTLGGLSCPAGQIAKRSGGIWVCAADNDALGGLACPTGQIAKRSGGVWACAADNDTLGGLTCAAGEIPKFNGASWQCAADVGGPLWKNLKTVALSGAEYTSIQAAIDSISDSAPDNPYLVMVGPGVYTETVTLQKWVHLIGAGQDVTIIRDKVDHAAYGGVVNMAPESSLRDLTAWNFGANPGFLFVGVSVNGAPHVLVQDVTAKADGAEGRKAGVYVLGSGASATLIHVTALAENEELNYGMIVDPETSVEVVEGTFTAFGGGQDYGIYASGPATSLVVDNATVKGLMGSATNAGLELQSGVDAHLFGGTYFAHSGDNTTAIAAIDSELTGDSIHAQASGAASANIGIKASSMSLANTFKLRDSTIEAAKGDTAMGIGASGVKFVSEGNVIRADNASVTTIGVLAGTTSGAMKGDRVEASSLSGTDVVGIRNEATLQAKEEMVEAKGDPTVANVYGYHGVAGSTNDLIDGSYSAVSGANAYGIYIQQLLNAREVTALASEASSIGSGLACEMANCQVWGGTYAGTASPTASGIYLMDSAFDGRDFNAMGSGIPGGFGIFLPAPINPPVNVHGAVLEGQGSPVMVPPGPMPIVTIGSSRLIGPLIAAPFPVVQCTLTSRLGLVTLGGPAPCP